MALRKLVIGAAVAVAAGASSLGAHAQLMARTTVLENVTIHLPDGQVIQNGAVAIRGARVVGVGESVSAPRNATRIDGRGMHVTPGLIDVSSALGVSGGESGGGLVTASAIDAFDRYDSRSFEEALSHGVTMIALAPSGQRGFGPAASVIRLRPNGDGAIVGDPAESRLSLTLNMRSTDGPLARLQTVESIRARLREAQEREKALEAHEKAIEEFMKKAEEKRKEKDKEKGEDKNKTGDKTATPPQSGQRPAGDAPTPPAGGEPRPRRPRPGMDDDAVALDDIPDLDLEDVDLQQRPPRRGTQQRPPQAPPAAAPAAAASESSRPKRPAPNRQLDIVISTFHHEIPVRVQADRAEDILNALEIASEFGLKIVIDGGAEAYMVADAIAAAEVPVIIGMPPMGDLPRSGNQLRARRDLAAKLDKAGVDWVFGSGGDSRNVLPAAQLLVAQSGLAVSPLALVTDRAATFLGVDDRVGRIKEGLQADLVLWSGDPLDPASRVSRVWIAGESVFERKEGDS